MGNWAGTSACTPNDVRARMVAVSAMPYRQQVVSRRSSGAIEIPLVLIHKSIVVRIQQVVSFLHFRIVGELTLGQLTVAIGVALSQRLGETGRLRRCLRRTGATTPRATTTQHDWSRAAQSDSEARLRHRSGVGRGGPRRRPPTVTAELLRTLLEEVVLSLKRAEGRAHLTLRW